MQKYIDAHCHIGCGATDNSVTAFFCNSVTESQWIDILKIFECNTAVFPCLGLHPWNMNDIKAGWDMRLIRVLSQYTHCMVGEIGLDKLHPNYDVQIDVFTRCLDIAAKMHRAVHIHCVRAWGDMLEILTRLSNLPPVLVFHAFSASPEIMQRLLKLKSRVYFSYSASVCDARRHNLANTVRCTPMDNILIESDGAMAESGDVLRHVALRIATIKNMPIESLLDTIYNNAQRVTQNG